MLETVEQCIPRDALVRELAWIICAHNGDDADYNAPGECRRCVHEKDRLAGCLLLSERAAKAVLDKLSELRVHTKFGVKHG